MDRQGGAERGGDVRRRPGAARCGLPRGHAGLAKLASRDRRATRPAQPIRRRQVAHETVAPHPTATGKCRLPHQGHGRRDGLLAAEGQTRTAIHRRDREPAANRSRWRAPPRGCAERGFGKHEPRAAPRLPRSAVRHHRGHRRVGRIPWPRRRRRFAVRPRAFTTWPEGLPPARESLPPETGSLPPAPESSSSVSENSPPVSESSPPAQEVPPPAPESPTPEQNSGKFGQRSDSLILSRRRSRWRKMNRASSGKTHRRWGRKPRC